jgi:peptidoglycan-associated lipoprotein
MTRTHIAIAVLLSVGVGCAKKTPATAAAEPPPVVATAPPPPPAVPEASTPSPAPAAALSEDELFARKSLADLNGEHPLGTVYFDYDRADLRDDARETISRNAAWLRRWPSTRIVVEGHSDERGTAEYNLSLGERRAAAVRSYLVSLGIADERVMAISKGKEAPLCTEPTEACWQQNRRGTPTLTAK